MKIFLSWSNADSKQVAKSLQGFLSTVFPENVEFWMSTDIGVGEKWFAQLTAALNDANIAILCLTPSNINSAWMLFEAGAVSKLKDKSLIVSFLLGFNDFSLLPGPLKQFQACEANEEGVKKLVTQINAQRGLGEIPQYALNALFELNWQGFEKNLNSIDLIELIEPEEIDLTDSVAVIPHADSIYSYLVEGFGVGHNRVVFACEIDSRGFAQFRREVEVEAIMLTHSLDTFLLVQGCDTKDDQKTLESPELVSEDNHINVKLDNIRLHKYNTVVSSIDQKQTLDNLQGEPFCRLTSEILFDPPLLKGDRVRYSMLERSTTKIYLDPKDSFGWGVYRPTRILELCVILPSKYKPRQWNRQVNRITSLGFASQQELAELQKIPMPTLAILPNGRHEIRLRIDHPTIGMVYRIYWSY